MIRHSVLGVLGVLVVAISWPDSASAIRPKDPSDPPPPVSFPLGPLTLDDGSGADDARLLRWDRPGPVPAGSTGEVAILWRPTQADRISVPVQIDGLVGSTTAGWTLLAIVPAGQGTHSSVQEPGTYAAGYVRRVQDAVIVIDPSVTTAPGTPSPIEQWTLSGVKGRAVGLFWKVHPSVQGKLIVLRGPGDGTGLMRAIYPGTPRLVPVPSAPTWKGVAIVDNPQVRGYTDAKVPAGSHGYVLAVLEPVPLEGGDVTWRSAFVSAPVVAQVAAPVSAPAQVEAVPPENDTGTRIQISWESGASANPQVGFVVLRSLAGDTQPTWEGGTWSQGWEPAHDEPLSATSRSFVDSPPEERAHAYAVAAVELDDAGVITDVAISPPTDRVAPAADWFNESLWATLAAIVLMTLGLMYYVPRVRKDPGSIFVRRIPGVDALEDSIGRATEMGRPVLYVTGTENIQNIQTIASLLCLGPIAEMTAEYDTDLKVANFEALTMVVAEEIVRQGFANAGRADAHRPENVMFISSEQFAFAAGVNGIILRDKPATNIYLGRFFAESLILAETGFVTKSVQIAGTAEVTQLPFFIAACDYTIIGEELYAVSAYLSRDPKLLATLKSADALKLLVIITVVVGATLATLGIANIGPWIAP